MNKNFKILVAFAWVFIVVSCQKKDTTPVDLSKVTVTFSNPAPGQVFHTGDTVQVNANVTYTGEILGIWIQIIDTTTGNKLFEDNHDTHTDHFLLPATWEDTFSSSATLQVRVSVFVANSPIPAVRSDFFVSEP